MYKWFFIICRNKVALTLKGTKAKVKCGIQITKPKNPSLYWGSVTAPFRAGATFYEKNISK